MEAIASPAIELAPSWDILCEQGRIAQQDMDRGRWTLGSLALDTGDRVDDFAREVNVPKKRVYEYKQVCAFYAESARAEFLDDNPMITYTHFRTAMKRRDVDKAYQFLDHCSRRGRTTDQAERLMSRLRGRQKKDKPLLDAAPCRIVAAQGQRCVTFEFTHDDDARRLRELYFKKTTAVVMTLATA